MTPSYQLMIWYLYQNVIGFSKIVNNKLNKGYMSTGIKEQGIRHFGNDSCLHIGEREKMNLY